jgi:ankyrin repeat protein
MINFIKAFVFIHLINFSSSVIAGSYDDFFKSIRNDNSPHIQSLLDRGFDANTINPDGVHGLFLALQLESFKVAQTLIQWPSTRVEWRNDKDESPLMIASIKGRTDLMKALIGKDADVNKTGWTPLHYAASGQQSDVVELLLEHSAYIDAESPNGSTPLMMAAMYGKESLVYLLLDAGADPSLKNHLGLTATDFAKRAGRESTGKLLEAAVIEWKRQGR